MGLVHRFCSAGLSFARPCAFHRVRAFDPQISDPLCPCDMLCKRSRKPVATTNPSLPRGVSRPRSHHRRSGRGMDLHTFHSRTERSSENWNDYADRRGESGEINRASGVAVPFGVRRCWRVSDPHRAEKIVHTALAAYRIRTDREFFRTDFKIAAQIAQETIAGASLEIRTLNALAGLDTSKSSIT